MSLYQPNDINLLSEHWESIMESVEKQKNLMLEPTTEEIMKVYKIILDYIKSTKRKVYGGTALNLLVSAKSPADAIYKPNKFADIDFYSPEPIVDLMKICNILHEKGFKNVSGREAMHQETYSITVNYVLYCDISYVPRNIYNKMPFDTINGITVIHPHFMWIDYLRMMTDPLISYWRFGDDLKSFKRFMLLQKHFPMPQSTTKMPQPQLEYNVTTALSAIFNFATENKSIIMIGFYAYNYFLNNSGILNDKKNKHNLTQIPHFEMISTNYRTDCLALLEILKNLPSSNNLTHTEYYPFFQFTGHSVEIYFGDNLLTRIFNHNKKCIPYQDVPAFDFQQNKTISKTTIRIGTFPVVLLYALINIMIARVSDDKNTKQLYYTMCANLLESRDFYFKANKKTFLDNTLFKEFVAVCTGDTIQPERQRRLLIESRKKKNKRYTFTYEPSDGVKEPVVNYMFANSSGNPINNPKNLHLTNVIKDEDPEGDIDEDSATSNSE